MTLAENIQKNKTKAWYFIGIIIAACFKGIMETIQKYLIEDTWWGDSLIIFTGYAVLAVSLIAPLIFGLDPEIKRVKDERKDIGTNYTTVLAENEGLKVTNQLQADILQQNQFKPYKYEGVVEKTETTKKVEFIP